MCNFQEQINFYSRSFTGLLHIRTGFIDHDLGFHSSQVKTIHDMQDILECLQVAEPRRPPKVSS